jgi:voltage-gated potassium channel
MNPNPSKRTNPEEYPSEDTPIIPSGKTTTQTGTSSSESHPTPFFFESLSQHYVPDRWEVIDMPENTSIRSLHHRHHRLRTRRSIKRRVFLFLTEPDTSIASAVFFFILLATISLMNLVMIMQTMQHWQYTPDDCRTCGGPVSYLFDDDDSIAYPVEGVPCVCPPTPQAWTSVMLKWMVWFFTVEWTLRVLSFEPPRHEWASTTWVFFCQWLSFVTSITTVLDALAIFPYYIEMISGNGLMSLRLLRLFRVFQLVRLGQYNESFMSLTTVLVQSMLYLKLLLGILCFGATFFGSMMYWLEKGDWMYFEQTSSYQFVRINQFGAEEISPFTSIPASCWWFIVTVTTVGYGDCVPTTSSGQFVASLAMLLGILVIAFPVSVFSELWSKELRMKGFDLDGGGGSDDGDADAGDAKNGEMSMEALPDADTDAAKGTSSYGHLSFESLPEDAATSPYSLDHRKAAAPDADHIVIRKDDLAEMVSHFQTITESQTRIRAILKKYHHRPKA